ncbi:hypothetical protein CDL12_01550 [Handroanthus impetiginosus]|uniref:Uncharacterized protein n=1 Tax=Handroanthus impetiginosus TaxID=429701 RepID=A0A2G9I7I2_9LAMI|nr:hypothetical protein CDL12_01550 [Handroanthus impetiginosus]
MDGDPNHVRTKDVLASITNPIQNLAVIYVVGRNKVMDFNTLYELQNTYVAMFLFRNKHVPVDRGTHKVDKVMGDINDKEKFADMVQPFYEAVSRGP